MAKQNQNSGKVKSNKKNDVSIFVKGYLFLYNFLQVLGWSYLLYQIITFYLITNEPDQILYETVKLTVILFQNAALLEIIHAATGIVPSNVLLTTFQVFSRVIVVCGVLMATPTGQKSPGLPLALLAWSITEIIRYGYYTLNIVDMVPYFLVWLRYTTFIILYPIGVTGELWCFYSAQQYVYENQMWTIALPNVFNFTFNYHYFLLLIMASYLPLFPQLYLHMFAQRRKIIGRTPTQQKKSKENDTKKEKASNVKKESVPKKDQKSPKPKKEKVK